MADKYDELTQLEAALDALKTQPREAQVRMLQYLSDRLAHDYQKAMTERNEVAKARVRPAAK